MARFYYPDLEEEEEEQVVDEIVIDGCAGIMREGQRRSSIPRFGWNTCVVEMEWHSTDVFEKCAVIRGLNPVHASKQPQPFSLGPRLTHWLERWDAADDVFEPPPEQFSGLFEHALEEAIKPREISSWNENDGPFRRLMLRCHLVNKSRGKSVCVMDVPMNHTKRATSEKLQANTSSPFVQLRGAAGTSDGACS